MELAVAAAPPAADRIEFATLVFVVVRGGDRLFPIIILDSFHIKEKPIPTAFLAHDNGTVIGMVVRCGMAILADKHIAVASLGKGDAGQADHGRQMTGQTFGNGQGTVAADLLAGNNLEIGVRLGNTLDIVSKHIVFPAAQGGMIEIAAGQRLAGTGSGIEDYGNGGTVDSDDGISRG